MVFPFTKFNKKNVVRGVWVGTAVLAPLLSWGQTTIVNYDFNAGISYATTSAVVAAGVTSLVTSSEAYANAGGTSSGSGAYTANTTAGNALAMNNSSGTTRYFEFDLGGASLPKYSAFKAYLQGYRSATGAATLTLQYSLNGGAYTSFGSAQLPTSSVFTEATFDLSALPALAAPTSLSFRVVASGASGTGTLRIDNFQVQATNTVDPTIASLTPGTVAAAGPDLTLSVTGSNFIPSSTVSFNGQNLATTYVSATSLTATVPASAVATAGSYSVVVTNPTANGSNASAASSFVVTAVVPRWTGRAGTGSWFAPANWSTGTVPSTADDVLLDHSFVAGSYTVSLDQNTSVSINSLTVNPGVGDSIFAVVPATNTQATALTLTNTGSGAVALAIYNKGVVTNASGATASGSTGIDVAGSGATMFIYNGGSYRHASSRSHTAVVENLSAVAGTEQGIFDFRLPSTGPSSYAISVSGRTYGTLILRNRPNQLATSYPGPGSSFTIQGDLLIGPGVTFTPTITNDLRLLGSVRVQGTFQVKVNATSTGTPQVVLTGNRLQTLSGNSTFESSIGLIINNPAGVVLAAPLLLSGTLTLTNGTLTTSTTNLLTLASGTTVAGASSTSFINGPVARQTAAGAFTNLLFPVGRGTAYRPVVLNATAQDATTYVVTQQEGVAPDPTNFLAGSASLPTLTRVSRVRSYTITPTPAANNFTGTVTISYGSDDNVNQPQPQDNSFTIGKNSNSAGWQNIGNSNVTVNMAASAGVGATGTITSQSFSSFSTFALASTSQDPTTNPLPVVLTSFGATRLASGAVQVTWTTASEKHSAYFEVQRSLDGRTFVAISRVAASGTTTQQHTYRSLDEVAPTSHLYYRLRQVDSDGTEEFSPVVAVSTESSPFTLYPNPSHGEITVVATVGAEVQVLDLVGRVLKTSVLSATGKLSVATLPTGTYLLRVSGEGQTRTLRFTKE